MSFHRPSAFSKVLVGGKNFLPSRFDFKTGSAILSSTPLALPKVKWGSSPRMARGSAACKASGRVTVGFTHEKELSGRSHRQGRVVPHRSRVRPAARG